MLRETPSLKQLRALQAVSRTGSFSAAASQLNLTTPAVHTQLKNLENTLGVSLAERAGSVGMKLTPFGEVINDLAERVESEFKLALREIDALRDGRMGHVGIGVVSTGKYFAPHLVASIMASHPQIDVSLHVGNREETIAAIREGRFRLAIMGRPPRDPVTTSEIIGPHPHVIVTRPDHPLAGLEHIPNDAFANETFLTREEGSGTRILMNRYLDRIGNGHVYKTIQMDSNETIKQSVMAGLGIAMISEHTVIEELRSGRLVRLKADGLPIIRQWFLLHPQRVRLSPCETLVMQTVSDMNGTFLPVL